MVDKPAPQHRSEESGSLRHHLLLWLRAASKRILNVVVLEAGIDPHHRLTALVSRQHLSRNLECPKAQKQAAECKHCLLQQMQQLQLVSELSHKNRQGTKWVLSQY